MKTLIIPFMAVLLLLAPSCCPHKRPCANRYCPPTAPTRPICPQEKKPCCQKAKPKCGCKKAPRRKPCARRNAVSLNEVMDYLPGLPPSYLSI